MAVPSDTIFDKSGMQTDETPPQIKELATSAGVSLELKGCWTALTLSRPGIDAVLRQALAGKAESSSVLWDLRQAEKLDHTGAQWLWTIWGKAWPESLEISPMQKVLIEHAASFTVDPPPRQKLGPWRMWLALGAWVVSEWQHVVDVVALAGQLLIDVLKWMAHPRKGPWRDISGHIYHIGATALPITALVGSLIGVVLAYLMSQQLKQYGADIFIVNILGIAVIRELGPVLAAILVAGRSGSAITAQIGVMRVNEELDAMSVMGISQSYRLVLPRAVALAFAMPLLSVWTTLAALAGGAIATDVTMGLSPAYFASALPKAVELSNIWLATGKAVVFGLLIAIIGCHYGLRVLPNTQSLGEGTTSSVVTSITMVILVDALFAVLAKNVGI